MSAVDSILNLALLFLWIEWRAARLVRRPQSVLTLASTVQPAEHRMGSGLGSLAALICILLVRPWLYHSIGSKLLWTPELDLLTLSLPWRTDLLDGMYVYSTATFLLTLGWFYSALLLLSVINRNMPDSEPIQQFVRLQLGWLESVPWPARLFLPLLVAGLAWAATAPLLVKLGLLPALPPPAALFGQALAFSLAALLSWKWLLIVLFLFHLVNTYVYLGVRPIWPYITATAQTLLKPVSFLTLPKLDLAPALGIGLVYCAAEFAVRPAVVRIFQQFST
jgi:hypothetical protein